jgi:hypothetical protein
MSAEAGSSPKQRAIVARIPTTDVTLHVAQELEVTVARFPAGAIVSGI